MSSVTLESLSIAPVFVMYFCRCESSLRWYNNPILDFLSQMNKAPRTIAIPISIRPSTPIKMPVSCRYSCVLSWRSLYVSLVKSAFWAGPPCAPWMAPGHASARIAPRADSRIPSMVIMSMKDGNGSFNITTKKRKVPTVVMDAIKSRVNPRRTSLINIFFFWIRCSTWFSSGMVQYRLSGSSNTSHSTWTGVILTPRYCRSWRTSSECG